MPFMKIRIAPLLLATFASTLCFAGQRSIENRPREGALKVGDDAPDFALSSPDGKSKVTLSSFKGSKPVVLVFGSYT